MMDYDYQIIQTGIVVIISVIGTYITTNLTKRDKFVELEKQRLEANSKLESLRTKFDLKIRDLNKVERRAERLQNKIDGLTLEKTEFKLKYEEIIEDETAKKELLRYIQLLQYSNLLKDLDDDFSNIRGQNSLLEIFSKSNLVNLNDLDLKQVFTQYCVSNKNLETKMMRNLNKYESEISIMKFLNIDNLNHLLHKQYNQITLFSSNLRRFFRELETISKSDIENLILSFRDLERGLNSIKLLNQKIDFNVTKSWNMSNSIKATENID